MLGHVFERCVEKRPLSVMVRATLERVVGADRLALWYQRTAQQQYPRELLFATVYALRSQVVFCIQPSVRAAYRAQEATVGTSLISVYNKRNGLDTQTSSELVRYSARELAPLMAPMGGERAPWLEGSRIKMVEGKCREAREPRLQALREATGRALPGKSLVGYEPAQGLVTEVVPCEDGHAQERSLLGAVRKSVRRNAWWSAARHCGPQAFRSELDSRSGFFVLREQRGFPWEIISSRRSCGRPPTGQLAAPRGRVLDAHGHPHGFRRRRIKRPHATRDGDTRRYLLTHFPRQVSARQVAQLYQTRWKLETAFQHLEASFHAAINP